MSNEDRAVPGYCPACGHNTLVSIEDGGGLTCTLAECPRPDALSELIAKPNIHHLVEFDIRTFTTKHPLIERVDDDLFRCHLDERLRQLDGPPDWVADALHVRGFRARVIFRILDDQPTSPDDWTVELVEPNPSESRTFL